MADKLQNGHPEQSVVRKIITYLLSPADPSNLGVFRILFGFLMMLDIPQERGFPFIAGLWETDMCYFSLFNFLKPLSHDWMHVVYAVMFCGAVGVMLGFFYRLSCLMLLVAYWYIFLLDKAVWNNHSYLYGLITIMLLLTDANRYWAIDGLLFPGICNTHVPKWNYTLFKFQIFLVYFYAGIKKLDRDWMGGYSMSGLARKWVFDPFRPFLSDENIDLYLVHISGLCYDLFVGFFLLFDKTRLVGILFSLAFHGMNSQMFHIGMFSYTMMGALPLFCSDKWPKNLLSRLPSRLSSVTPLLGDARPSSHCIYPSEEPENQDDRHGKLQSLGGGKSQVTLYHKVMLVIFSFFVGIQCFLPYSHFVTKGYNGWTEGLYGYSWDMMVHSWSTQHVRIKVVDQPTGNELFIRPGAFVGGGQKGRSRWNSHPDMIKQYMTCLAEKLKQREDLNITEPELYLDVWRSLNQRFQQRFVDPNVNLVKAPWSPFVGTPWTLPLLTELSSWREKMKEIEEKQSQADLGNFTEIVFVADFPGLSLENFVSEELNTSLMVLKGRVHVEMNNKNVSLDENQEITVPSNATHVVYTVSDSPACWMYVYLNTTILKNETIKQWVLHPETIPDKDGNRNSTQKSVLERFREFLTKKFFLFHMSFWNSYHAIGRLVLGLPYPPEEEDKEEDNGSNAAMSAQNLPSEEKQEDEKQDDENQEDTMTDEDQTVTEQADVGDTGKDDANQMNDDQATGETPLDGGQSQTNIKSEL